MTEGHDPRLSIEDQARLWVLECKDDPARRAAAMRWCDEAAEHRIAFDEAEAKLMRLDAAGESLRSREPEGQNMPSRQGLWKLAIAASVIGLLVIGILGFRKEVGQPEGQREVAVGGGHVQDDPLVLSTKRGEVRKVTLTDGSVVTLDSDSRLLVWMRSERRDLELDHGRVHFEVAHDRARPFTVMADGGSTTALGTVFDVERRAQCKVNIVLFEGKVAVTPPCQRQQVDGPVVKRYLEPGERLRYSASAAQEAPAVPEAAPENEGQWVTGVKSYNDETVGSILAEVNLYSQVQLVADTPEIANMRVSADLHIRNPQNVAKHLARSLGLTVEFQGNDKIILKK
ncbi:putative anti-sigma factor [Sphingobium sp. SYK-6]|uniref:FecR family protein n=1 Tax=Sphingobium sp. (strain NBRC 103272 / SYK-6) TaxID=627192 RepID=UPI0002277563|nr:FecR domain-containing protein [Sphingobium sp. SYK-6]BAK66645.1 putative anti-sigma factor [Sphingobium sp. SYK-6]